MKLTDIQSTKKKENNNFGRIDGFGRINSEGEEFVTTIFQTDQKGMVSVDILSDNGNLAFDIILSGVDDTGAPKSYLKRIEIDVESGRIIKDDFHH